MDPIERIEAMMEQMAREPDRVFHEFYIVIILHGCVGLETLTTEQREKLIDSVAMACMTILCPPIALNAIGDEIYLLVQQNPHRSVQAMADAVEAALGDHCGDRFSAISIGPDDVDRMTAAINDGTIVSLLSSWVNEE